MVLKNRPGFGKPAKVGSVLLAAGTVLVLMQARVASAQPAPARGYTAIGDSISVGSWADDTATVAPTDAGGDLTFTNGFSRQVLNSLVANGSYAATRYHNRAIKGATVTNTLEPRKSVLEYQVAKAVSDNPDLVTLTVGINDVQLFSTANGAADEAKIASFRSAFQPGLSSILSRLRAGAPTRLICVANVPRLWMLPGVYNFRLPPSTSDAEKTERQEAAKTVMDGYIAAANDIIRNEALLNQAKVVDIYSDPVTTIPANVATRDGFHPNRAGHVALAAKVLDAVAGPVISVSAAPGARTTISEGDGKSATTLRVTRSGNTSAALTVSFRVPTGPRLKAPAAVVIPAGSAFKDFPVNAIDTALVEGDEDYTVVASAPGTLYLFDPAGVVRVTDNETGGVALTATIAPGAFTEGAKASVVLMVSHNRSAKSPAVTVNLSSTDARYTLPATITIAATTRTKSVTIPFTADAVNQGTVDSTVVATAGGFTGSTAHATVYDSLAELSLAVASPYSASFGESTVPTGRTSTVLRVTRNTLTGGAVTVNLSVRTGAGQVTIPATAIIEAGQSFVDVPIVAVNDANVDGLQRVIVEAKAAGFKGVKGINLYVYDDDAVAPPISAPAVSQVALSAATADAAKGTVTLTFIGAVAASAGDATNYGVTGGGVELAVTGAARKGANSVELAVDGLIVGTGVAVTYDIVDASGKALKGCTKATVK